MRFSRVRPSRVRGSDSFVLMGCTPWDVDHRFKSIRFLLIDTKVPRDTKSLVAGVGARLQRVRFCFCFFLLLNSFPARETELD